MPFFCIDSGEALVQFASPMYAVIQTGGKQYRVQAGDILAIEKLEGEVGGSVQFPEVLMAAKQAEDKTEIFLGKPLLSGAKVDAEIVGQGRGDKVVIVKMKRRKQYRRTQGHRQPLTQVIVTSIDAGAAGKAQLSAEDKKKKLTGFSTSLKPKGEAFSVKLQGSRKRRIAAKAAANAGGAKAAAGASQASTKKTAKAAPKKAAE
jgi:large subunit ribosomal protein L21